MKFYFNLKVSLFVIYLDLIILQFIEEDHDNKRYDFSAVCN